MVSRRTVGAGCKHLRLVFFTVYYVSVQSVGGRIGTDAEFDS